MNKVVHVAMEQNTKRRRGQYNADNFLNQFLLEFFWPTPDVPE